MSAPAVEMPTTTTVDVNPHARRGKDGQLWLSSLDQLRPGDDYELIDYYQPGAREESLVTGRPVVALCGYRNVIDSTMIPRKSGGSWVARARYVVVCPTCRQLRALERRTKGGAE